jgi:hypothetical protein
LEAKERSLSLIHFSKEFPSNWEIEWKANLATLDPAGFIFRANDLLGGESFTQFWYTKSLGNASLGIRYFDLLFHYFGHKRDGEWIEDFVLAQPDGIPILIPRVKTNVDSSMYGDKGVGIVIREETKFGIAGAFPFDKIDYYKQEFNRKAEVETSFVGTLQRERYSFFLSNLKSHRNWSLVSDRCKSIEPSVGKLIAQVEVEYKGRDGISPCNLITQKEALGELNELANLIVNNFGEEVVQPTLQTKFEWLLDLVGK